MTKARSIKQPPLKPLREGRGAKSTSPQPVDACELFLTELQNRRERLQQLLTMVHLEAGRLNAARAPAQPRHKCTGSRSIPSAI